MVVHTTMGRCLYQANKGIISEVKFGLLELTSSSIVHNRADFVAFWHDMDARGIAYLEVRSNNFITRHNMDVNSGPLLLRAISQKR